MSKEVTLPYPKFPLGILVLVMVTALLMTVSGAVNGTYKLIDRSILSESAFIGLVSLAIYLYVNLQRKEPFSINGAALFVGAGFAGHILLEMSGINNLFF